MKWDNFAWILKLEFLAGYRTYIAAAGLFGLALHHFSVGQFDQAVTHVLAALAALGLREAFGGPPLPTEPPDEPPF